jgi:hypothetical protein
MNAMTTLGDVWNQADALASNCTDRTIPVSDISFESLDSMTINGNTHKLRTMAQKSICYRLGTPHQYLRKCPADVQALNMNHWIKKEKNEKLLARFDGDEIRAIFTPRYIPVDNFEVLNQLDALGYKPETQVQCALDDQFMLLNIPDPEKEFLVKANDRMRAGISVRNSEIGLSSLAISAYVLRLVCTNGLISMVNTGGKSYRHVSSKLLEEFPKTIFEVGANKNQQRDLFRFSLESKVNDPLKSLESFSRQFMLNELEKDAVAWAWPQESGETMFNLVNTFTRAAQYAELPAASSYNLQKVGGTVLAMVH